MKLTDWLEVPTLSRYAHEYAFGTDVAYQFSRSGRRPEWRARIRLAEGERLLFETEEARAEYPLMRGLSRLMRQFPVSAGMLYNTLCDLYWLLISEGAPTASFWVLVGGYTPAHEQLRAFIEGGYQPKNELEYRRVLENMEIGALDSELSYLLIHSSDFFITMRVAPVGVPCEALQPYRERVKHFLRFQRWLREQKGVICW
ncbi:MAG: hypothetical protein WHS44_03580 [Fimbriimonadales bacterium]